MSRNYKFRTWSGGSLFAGLLGGLLALSLAPAPASAQSIEQKQQMLRDRLSKFNLAAGPSVILQVNKLQCGATSEGETCVDTFGSPTGGGGFWPTGTPDTYMFSSGLQVAGLVRAGAGCTRENRNGQNTPTCFKWSGDTTAALFFEGSGNLHHGTPITDMYNSLDPADLAIWPTPGSIPDFPEATSMIINDTSLFNDVLIGRKAASQQDSWVAYWDGDPVRSGGRTHPMGILAEQRSLAWNYPQGNEATLYLIYRLTNVTNNRLFQQVNEARYFGGRDSLPDAGWAFDSVYVAYSADPDVGPATNNHATGILPFSMAIAYIKSFTDASFVYPADEFRAPFFPRAPGIVGMKFLKSPINPATGQELGLTALSLVTNGGAFPDANSVQRAWRYISLNTDPSKGDGSCSYPAAVVKLRRACYLGQVSADVRVFMASGGGFSLEPGQSATIAASIIVAATVATPLINTSVTGDNPPGLPSTQPGCPNGAPVRPIEVASGWLASRNCPEDPNAVLSQSNVTVVPGSLLGKALVAQNIFDGKFLLGFAPEPPDFFLVPGNNAVTVVWEPSRTDVTGDPFFSAASDNRPSNALFDPNYRQFDVEGYRIYRGTRASDLQLIAQFDKIGTTFIDRTCVTDGAKVTGSPCVQPAERHTIDLNGEFVQFTNVDALANGSPIVIRADTALATQIAAGTSRQLSDTGIPFSFTDTQVRNGFQYFYKVTAFDINSIKSGPSSLESAGGFKSTIPQASSAALTAAEFSSGVYGRGKLLNPAAPRPTIDPVKGTFSGPEPPSNLLTGVFTPFAGQLLRAGFKEIRVDSVQTEYYPNGFIGYVFLSADGTVIRVNMDNRPINGGGPPVNTYDLGVVTAFASDPAVRAKLQAAGLDASPTAGSMSATITVAHPAAASQQAEFFPKATNFLSGANNAFVPAGACVGGSRWFTGTNETKADPTLNSRQNGEIEGVAIFKPTPFLASGNSITAECQAPPGMTTYTFGGRSVSGDVFRRFYGQTIGVHRAADVKLYWGATGLDSIIDITHNVPVPFSPAARASYGFLTDADGNGVLNHGDFVFMEGLDKAEFAPFRPLRPTSAFAAQPVVLSTDGDGNLTGDGQGFGLYINGEPFQFVGARPTSGVWTLRTYGGAVTRNAAGVYSFNPLGREPFVPGLSFRTVIASPATIVAANADLTQVHAVPDPYYGVSLFDLGPANKELQFVNLPPQATVRIYSMSGVLVDIVNHDNPSGGGTAKWDLRNRSNQFVASGVYYFHVSTPEGKSHVGKFTVIGSGLGN